MVVLNALTIIVLVPLGLNTEDVLYKLMAGSVIGVTTWQIINCLASNHKPKD
jgi:hypothetical protein